MKSVVFFRKFHKWLGLIIGIQMLLWVLGGVVMSFFDIEKVRGEHNIATKAPVNLNQTLNIGASQVLTAVDFDVQQLQLMAWLGKPAWLVTGEKQKAIFDAQTGQRVSPLSEALARQVAENDFSGNGKIIQAHLLTESLGEVRAKEYPLWQLQFDDQDNTRIYVSAHSGQVEARRNDTWRLFDFFWMLHIMDYKNRTDFNHPLLLMAAILALMMAISGLYLVIKLIFLKPKRTKIHG